MLNFQAEFVRVQAERDRERDAKQAERDRERDAEQAERDQRLVAEFACMQAERDKERDAKQAERDRERDAKQAERDRRLHERDLQLMQTLEVMQSEIVSLKQKYETIPKTVQELSERVDSVQVANANIVEEISVLTNRVEQLEIDTTQVIENKVIEQVHKVENEVIKEIDQKVHAAIEARDVGSSADVQDLKKIVQKDIPLWQQSVDRRLAEMELSLRHDEARAVEQLEIDTTQVIENKVIEQVHKVENEVIKEIDQKVHAAIEARDVGSSADVQDLKKIVQKDIPLWQQSVHRRLAEMELSLRHDEARAYVTPARSNNDRHINTAVKNCDCETEQATNMFRRALAFFCLPCGRETETEDLRVIEVCDEDADPVEFSPQDYNVVRLQLRWAPGQKGGVSPRTREPQKTLMSADAAYVSVYERPGLQDSQQEGPETGKVSDATTTWTVAVVPSGPDGGASSVEEAPPAARRRRGSRRCWAERLGHKVMVRPQGRRGYRLRSHRV
ncbi:uncharacterized protein LOC124788603 [Schistocerca piceifrons]|uniref:uncharacterized protein LOC124788603 n=1 Tax=Schistocerca piceifrons TaxID=274613 RepID=UPI001F5FBB58|nr:uncharacterized protein LOC124788603 [Schistocerca piceifrons]